MKKIISFITCLTLILGIFPVGVFGADELKQHILSNPGDVVSLGGIQYEATTSGTAILSSVLAESNVPFVAVSAGAVVFTVDHEDKVELAFFNESGAISKMYTIQGYPSGGAVTLFANSDGVCEAIIEEDESFLLDDIWYKNNSEAEASLFASTALIEEENVPFVAVSAGAVELTLDHEDKVELAFFNESKAISNIRTIEANPSGGAVTLSADSNGNCEAIIDNQEFFILDEISYKNNSVSDTAITLEFDEEGSTTTSTTEGQLMISCDSSDFTYPPTDIFDGYSFGKEYIEGWYGFVLSLGEPCNALVDGSVVLDKEADAKPLLVQGHKISPANLVEITRDGYDFLINCNGGGALIIDALVCDPGTQLIINEEFDLVFVEGTVENCSETFGVEEYNVRLVLDEENDDVVVLEPDAKISRENAASIVVTLKDGVIRFDTEMPVDINGVIYTVATDGAIEYDPIYHRVMITNVTEIPKDPRIPGDALFGGWCTDATLATKWTTSDAVTTESQFYTTDIYAYALWIQGVQVTSENQTDILGDGSVQYVREILYLNDATIQNPSGAGIKTDLDELYIYGQDGDNNIFGATNGIIASGTVQISGTVGDIVGSDSGIYAEGAAVIVESFADVDEIRGETMDGIYADSVSINGTTRLIQGEQFGVCADTVSVYGVVSELIQGEEAGIQAEELYISGEVGAIRGTTSGVISLSEESLISFMGTTANISGQAVGIHCAGLIEIWNSTVIVTASEGKDALVFGDLDLLETTTLVEPTTCAITYSAIEDLFVLRTGENLDEVVSTFKTEQIGFWITFVTYPSDDYIEGQKVMEQGKVVKPQDPTRSGYRFGGWYVDEACTESYDFDAEVTEDLTLYAKWIKRSSSKPSSSTTTQPSETETEDTVVTLPEEVTAAANSETAEKIEVKVPEGGATVKIPVSDATAGTIVVLVKEDGTEEILKQSVVTEDGVIVALEENAEIKIIDGSKDFTDVPDENYWASAAIDFVTSRKIYNGTSDTTFHPNNTMTRGMLAMVLHNLEGNPDVDSDLTFPDVKDGAWYEEAVLWAAEEGIVSGYTDGSYGSDDAITREQLAVMLWKYAGAPTSDHGLAGFADQKDISNYAKTAMAWANEKGIINGMGGDILNPKGYATRAQVAQMVMNYLEGLY